MIKTILLALVLFSGLISSANTVLVIENKSEGFESSKEYTLPTRFLRSERLIEMVKSTTAKALDHEFEESHGSLKSFSEGDKKQFAIKKQVITNGVVTLLEVNVVGKMNHVAHRRVLSTEAFSCTVDLERYELNEKLISEYAFCTTDDGYEIEYEE